jgi:hypothetical protein
MVMRQLMRRDKTLPERGRAELVFDPRGRYGAGFADRQVIVMMISQTVPLCTPKLRMVPF